MALTVRKTIIDQMLYQFGTIRIANGYDCDIATVCRQRDTEAEPFTPDECPAINLRDGDVDIVTQVSRDEHQLRLTVELHTTSAINADTADAMLGDIVVCIENNSTWAGNADGTTIERHSVNISQAGDTIEAGYLQLLVNYTTEKGKI